VLHLITELCPAGAQTALVNLLSRTNSEKFSPSVACLFNGEGEIPERIRSMGITVTDLEMSSKASLGAVGRLRHLLKRESPLILHLWLFHAVFLGRLLGRFQGVPIIVTSRRSERLGSDLRERLNRWSQGLSDCTIAVSEAVRKVEIQTGGTSPERVVTIHNGVNADLFRPKEKAEAARAREELKIPEGALVMGAVGRLHPAKGYSDLLKALVSVRNQFPGVILLIVGEGELHQELEARSQALGLGGCVIFTGSRVDVADILPAIDLLVLSSWWEGLPNSLLEGMAGELPVVATRVGGIPEVVDDGESGLLVEPRNPMALADACVELLRDPRLREEMGRRGRRRVEERFTVESCVGQTERLYDSLLLKKLDLRYEEQKGWRFRDKPA